MQELINFSVYSSDTERFSNDWQAIAAYTQQLDGITGMELLISYDPLPDVPPGLVRGVHLPYWVTWLDVWREGEAGVARYFPDIAPDQLYWYCGGSNAQAMVATLRQLLVNAAVVQPAYAVFHVSHAEVLHSFTYNYPYSACEVVLATAELLNAVAATFPQGEPPVRLLLENLWLPGLTFTDNAIAETLAQNLNFENWGFMFDTGHLMNINHTLRSEAEGIAFVLQTIDQLSSTIRARIEGLHFHYSISGEFQQQIIAAGLPNTDTLSLGELRALAQQNVFSFDQHRPFTLPACLAIVETIQPQYLVHEFLSSTQTEYDQKLTIQRAALKGCVHF
jgi:hypothetical protein